MNEENKQEDRREVKFLSLPEQLFRAEVSMNEPSMKIFNKRDYIREAWSFRVIQWKEFAHKENKTPFFSEFYSVYRGRDLVFSGFSSPREAIEEVINNCERQVKYYQELLEKFKKLNEG